MKKLIQLVLLFVILIETGIAQNLDTIVSGKNYIDAFNFYNQGRYEDALNILNGPHAIYNDVYDQNWIILKGQTFLEMKDALAANKEFTKLIKYYPNYQPAPHVYQEDLYTNMRYIAVSPGTSIGAKVARTFPIFTTKKVYSIFDSTNYDAPYKMIKGYCYAFYIQENLKGNFALVLDYAYNKVGYNRKLTRKGINNFDLKYSEIIYNNELGLSLKKYILKDDSKLLLGRNISPILHNGTGPYLSIGGYYSKMRQAQANVELNYQSTNIQTQFIETKNLTRNNIDVKEMRNKKIYGISAAVGSSLTIKQVVVSLEVKYLYATTHLTNSENKYENTELIYNYYYVDNDVTYSRIDVSLSLAFILHYNVKSKFR
ncbi:MAG: hypothetical protein IPP32_04855 [Bacteroidetes bacterium]|nr:hypothetical protein [Bacteroidota bacterium]